jgi:hypothetical protein
MSSEIIDTLFTQEVLPVNPMDPVFEIGIDDGDDDFNEDRRGTIHIYSTLEVRICAGEVVAIQRLTPEEARKAAQILIRYADIVETLSEDIAKDFNELEDLA